MARIGASILFLASITLFAACGGGTKPAGGGGSESDATVTDATTTEDSGGGGGGGNGTTGGAVQDIPTIADGYYKTGTAHVEISGDKGQTVDVELVGAASGTFTGSTVLQYVAGEGNEGVSVVIGLDQATGASVGFTSAVVVAGGGPEQGCSFNLDRNDASGIGGSFACSGLAAMSPGALTTSSVTLAATFTANR
jgi:hypothetical protein